MTNRLASVAIAAALVVVASLVPPKVEAQNIARRVSQVRDGRVRFTFAARPDVCGYGNSISRGGNTRMNWSSDISPDVAYDEECSHSPVRIVLLVDEGKITKLRTYVGGRWRTDTPNVTDLGAVSVREATDYLLSLAANDRGAVGRDAIMPATLADSVVVWTPLFRIARDDDRPSSTKKQALFWLGQAAADKISPAEARGVKRESEDEEVKKSAVFALSQRRNGEAIPALLQVARNNRDPEVRKAAMFWLGQSGDPRAIELFEQILR
jgi:HEAT repeats